MTIPCLPVTNAGSFFSGGRAPICWQQQMKRPSTTPKAIERACNWLPELTGQPAPKLRSQPLFGDCLAELVTPLPPAEEPAPAVEPKRPRVNEQRPSTDHTSSRKMNHFPTQQKDGPKPGTQPARATATVLSRLAGQHGSARQQRPTTNHQLPATSYQPPATDHRPLPTSEHREWPEHVANSVRRRLSGGLPAQAIVSGLERLPAPEYGLPQDLAAQWQQPLTGQTISTEQLAAWLNKSRRELSGNGRPEQPILNNGYSPQPADHRERETTAARPTATPPFYRRGRGLSITSGRRQYEGRPITGLGDGETAVYPTDQLNEMDVDTAARFAPPRMATTLPGLRPPPWPGAAREGMGMAVTPSPAPIATLVARESAKREAATTPEDLDDLARKLTQILEEESRRHGIDV